MQSIHPRGFVHKDAQIDQNVQNSLKKLNIFKSSAAIKVPDLQKKEEPKSILKSGTLPSVSAIGASLKSCTTHTVEIFRKNFRPQFLTVEKGDTVEFVVNPKDDSGSNYVICVEDIDESDLLTPGAHFKTAFPYCGEYTIKCSINYEMKGKIEVVMRYPKCKEWERPVIPSASRASATASVSRVLSKSVTSLEAVKEKDLLQTMSTVLETEENLETKSLSRKELEDTFSNYSPVMFDIINHDLAKEDRHTEDLPKIDEVDENEDEEQEHKFLEQQRTSSRSSRAKSRSNKNSPESSKSKTSCLFNPSASCFRNLNLSDSDDKVENKEVRAAEEECEFRTQYSNSVDTMNSYRPINKQSRFCMLFHSNFENSIWSNEQKSKLFSRQTNEEVKVTPSNGKLIFDFEVLSSCVSYRESLR